MSHRRLYAVATSPATVIDLLACDGQNPRSILFHLTEIRDQVNLLPGAMVQGHLSDLARAVLKLQSTLAVRTPEALDPPALLTIRDDLADLSDLLVATYFQ
jgi:uncharacterized alpha-E superfamily protein